MIEFGYRLLIISKRLNNAHEDKILHGSWNSNC